MKKHIYGNIAIKEKMKARIKSHKWLIVSIPDWGKVNKNVRGITSKEHTDLRRICNSALKPCTTYFWKEYKAVVLNTGFLRLDRDPNAIHLSGKDQLRYNEIIFSVARKLLCDVCH